ncbi:MAG: hypothetical protein KatS3mg077_1400 [Candidatus Binatia bacterium]|nr:MAG: hypothetical protein KatS3mg077_1400 [Candidatus Binatia bacterium]
MQSFWKVGFAGFCSLLCSGCATVISGPTQQVRIISDPPGAVVTIGTRQLTTPATVELPRKSNYRLTIEKEGYEPAQREISRKINSQVYWNALAGGMILGFIVDSTTGALYELEPSVVQVSLVPREDQNSEPETSR